MRQDMATFYPTSTSQIDVLSTPYIEDQKYTSFSEQPILHGNTMMMYLNPSSDATSFPGISQVASSITVHNNNNNCVDAAGRNEMMFIPPTGDSMCIQTINEQLNTATTTDTVNELQRSQLNSIMDGEKNNNMHGLSLSLSTQIANTVPPSSFQHHFSNPQALSSVLNVHGSGESSCRPMSDKHDEGKDMQQQSSSAYGYELHGGGGDVSHNPQARFEGVVVSSNLHCSVNNNNNNSKGLVGYNNSYQYEQAGIASTLLKSKYLKAAQMLLDEVINVREALKHHDSGKDQNKMEEGSSESKDKSVQGSEANNNETGNASSAPEISPAERQDLQNKLDKLLAMLDEVDRRYKQYYHQMQILVSSFDMVAGTGAAKPYTTLALKTISRHFRCLRDAISGQIQQTRKNLGDQDSSQGGVIPRLRYIDQQLRQQRALQQFGMMRHAWRPQRGLPENAVTILRAWLFEHFLHPYPKDSEKIMLARQTGLTRSQVANWFINARVRLWKPMVEEMYKEEFGESDLGICKSSPENTTRGAPGERSSWASDDNRREDNMQESISSMGGNSSRSQHNHDESSGMMRRPAGIMMDMPNEDKHRGLLMKLQQDEQHHQPQHHQHQQHGMGGHHGFYQHDQNGFMVQAYHVPGLGGYSMNNNQVSLALGLRQIEGEVGSLGSTPTGGGFRSNTGSIENAIAVAPGTTDQYHTSYIDPVNQQQHRFGNSHLLNDFVA